MSGQWPGQWSGQLGLGFGLGLGLPFGAVKVRGNIPWGQLSQNGEVHLSTLMKVVSNLLQYHKFIRS